MLVIPKSKAFSILEWTLSIGIRPSFEIANWSILTQAQVERDVGGSVILHWRPNQVKGTIIPILTEEKQIQIRQKVTKSFVLRRQSKHLLECAKRAVEIAIEQDEQTATDWLENETAANWKWSER